MDADIDGCGEAQYDSREAWWGSSLLRQLSGGLRSRRIDGSGCLLDESYGPYFVERILMQEYMHHGNKRSALYIYRKYNKAGKAFLGTREAFRNYHICEQQLPISGNIVSIYYYT